MRELLLLSGCEKFAGESKLSAAPSVVGVGCWLSVVGLCWMRGGRGRREQEARRLFFFMNSCHPARRLGNQK